MRNYIWIACTLILLPACQLATFTARPGVIVREYPMELRGTYRAIDKNNGIKDTHTLVITATGASMDDPLMDRIFSLSDTNTTLSHLGDYFYLNIRETDSAGTATWYVYPFELEDGYLYVHTLALGKSEKKMLKYIKPTGKKKGEFYMDNEPFKNYCEKHLKKRKALKLKRIK